MNRLQLAPGLALPLEAVTQTFGVLAVRGAGKSNLAAVMAEEMHAAGLPFVVVDPVGAWWGLRSAADGRGAGLPIPIFGGSHGDVPLERTGGQLLADLVVDERLTCVLDIAEFSEGDKTRFLIDFAERLYRRNQDPLHLFLEEADDYAPQRPMREQARLLRAWENVVRRGRARGLGITMITQRSAALNKNVLTQIETLFVLRTTSPQDRKAIGAWVEYHGQARELLESLPSLAAGEAWCWSPSWLGKLQRVQVRRRRTFDSGATPKDLKGRRAPATIADVDLKAIEQRMAATIERAKQDDPKELRRQVVERDRRIRELEKRPTAAPEVRDVPKPVLRSGELARVEKLVDRLGRVAEALPAAVQPLAAALRLVAEGNGHVARRPAPPKVVRPAIPTPRRAPVIPSGDVQLRRGARRMLEALARRHPAPTTASQVAQLAGLARTGGTFSTYLSDLRRGGFIVEQGDYLDLTPAGQVKYITLDPPARRDRAADAATQRYEAQERRRQEQRKREQRRRRRILAAIGTKLAPGLPGEADLRFLAHRFVHEMQQAGQKRACEALELEPLQERRAYGGGMGPDHAKTLRQYFERVPADGLSRALVLLALAPELEVWSFDGGPPIDLLATAKRLGVDVATIDRQVRSETRGKARGEKVQTSARRSTKGGKNKAKAKK
jgi:uncharacterized protein